MLYALVCRDKPNALDLRMANRENHLAYAAGTGVVVLGGPLLDEDGAMCGSLLAIEVDDMAAAKAWSDNDPYAKAGLFESVEITAWKKTLG
ncbi:MAG: YciI family protein [Paracoccaceae bacterium]|nr:YciI family protein [Paracoccaceae bacterium]MDP7186119.1 YciI family protein [Paracoccaceae bacterium]